MRTPPGQLAYVAALLGLLLPGLTHAQDSICAGSPKSLPICDASGCTRLDGPPKWFTADPSLGDSRTSLNDPRWANAPKRQHETVDGFAGDDATKYRIGYDAVNHQLLVSFQTINANGDNPTGNDAVYFGISGGPDSAYAVKITPPPFICPGYCPDADTPIDIGAEELFQVATMNGAGNWSVPNSLPEERPSWMLHAAAWTNQSREPGQRGSWGMNFKVDLSSGTNGVNVGVNTQPRVWIGGQVVLSETAPMAAFYRTPFVGTDAATKVFSAENMMPRLVWPPVDDDTARGWMQLTSLGEACQGISLPRPKIGVIARGESPKCRDQGTCATCTQPGDCAAGFTCAGDGLCEPTECVDDSECGPGFRCETDICETELDYEALLTNRLNQGSGLRHRFVATPQTATGGTVAPFTLAAKFRIANWGTVGANSRWKSLNELATPLNNAGRFETDCPDNAGDDICGFDLSELIDNGGYSHQCVLVEMEELGNSTPDFATSSEFRNLRFDEASTVRRVASIDVGGLEELLGAAQTRDVYMFVETRNMPKPTDKPAQLDTNALFAARYNAMGDVGCDAAAACVEPLEGPPVCATQCEGEYYSCPSGSTQFWTLADDRVEGYDCWCRPQEFARNCYPKPRDGRDDLTPEEQIAEVWPYILVRPYVDTGRRVQSNGQELMVVNPMYPFSMAVDHKGDHYGWTQRLTGLDVEFEAIDPDEGLYRMRVPNESVAHLEVEITARDNANDVELTDIRGAATRWGVFGTATVVGLSEVTKPVDLSQASVRVSEFLGEDGTELVTNLPSPTVLTQVGVATPHAAYYQSTVGPHVSAHIVDLPLLGRLTTLTAKHVNIEKPAACGWYGSATLKTSFSIEDGSSSPVVVSGEDEWSCIPYGLVN